jgi:hypothetical protein
MPGSPAARRRQRKEASEMGYGVGGALLVVLIVLLLIFLL